MFILLKKEKIISYIITLCVIIGLFVFASANKTDVNTIQASSGTVNNVASSINTNIIENNTNNVSVNE